VIPLPASRCANPSATWRAVIAVLREKAATFMLKHADSLELPLAGQGSDEPTVRLSLTDDVVQRFSNSARWRLGIPFRQ
jgi:hypothetical protein